VTFRQAFVDAVSLLNAGRPLSDTPELDARVLLAHAAGINHAGLLARWPDPVPESVALAFRAALDRRRAGEPVAWITGSKEFFGLDFLVPVGLLVPRADTETLVEAALELLPTVQGSGRNGKWVDVCTGTGCVAVALAARARGPVEAWACDLSPLAVETARTNAARLLPEGRTLRVVESNLLSKLPGPWDLVISNPPYLTPRETEERVGDGGWREPALALDGGGEDGLDLIRTLVLQASARLTPGGWLLIEAADAQMDAIEELYRSAGLESTGVWRDLAGQRRVVGGRKTEELSTR
jgi:release factor glutamine methyltransferase